MRNTCSLHQFRDDLGSIWRKRGFLKDEIFINYNIQDCKGLKLSFEKQVYVSHPHVACSRLFSQTLCYSHGHLPGPQVSSHTLPLVAIGWCYCVILPPKREPFTIKPLRGKACLRPENLLRSGPSLQTISRVSHQVTFQNLSDQDLIRSHRQCLCFLHSCSLSSETDVGDKEKP